MSVFPQTDHNGCFFHFCQAHYRKIVNLGFKNRYHNESSFSLKIRCFSALAFLPCHDVVAGFEELSEDEDIPEEFLSYFELSYIGVMRGRGSNRRRSTPLFPIPMWNIHSRVQNCMPCTNNSVDGFNNVFFPKYRPVSFKYLEMYCIFKEGGNFSAYKNSTIRTRG